MSDESGLNFLKMYLLVSLCTVVVLFKMLCYQRCVAKKISDMKKSDHDLFPNLYRKGKREFQTFISDVPMLFKKMLVTDISHRIPRHSSVNRHDQYSPPHLLWRSEMTKFFPALFSRNGGHNFIFYFVYQEGRDIAGNLGN